MLTACTRGEGEEPEGGAWEVRRGLLVRLWAREMSSC